MQVLNNLMAFDKMNSAGFLANLMARLFARGLQQRIKPLGLAPAQFMTLLELWNEDGITQKELVSRLDVEQATMANTITRMVRDGLIERRTHPDDGRAQSLHLTQKAKAVEHDAVTAAKGVNQAAFRTLSDEEQKQFKELMRKVIGNMKNETRL